MKDSIRAKCTTAYVGRNHLYLSVAWLQRYQQTSQKMKDVYHKTHTQKHI